MTTIRELTVKFGFDVDDAGLNKLESGLDNIKNMASAVAIGLTAAAGTIFGLAKSTANFSDEVMDTAIAVGLSSDEMQKLGYAASLSGTNMQQLADGLKDLSKKATEASRGNEQSQESFKRLGVSVADASGKIKPTNQLFTELSDKFKALPAGAEKTRLSLELFGGSGGKLVQMLDNGSEGLARMGTEAERMGFIMSEDALSAGKAFNDTLTQITTVLVSIKNSIGSALIPVLQVAAERFRDFIIENREFIKVGIERVLGGIVTVISSLSNILFTAGNMMVRFSGHFGGLIPILKYAAAALGLFAIGKLAMALGNTVSGFIDVARAAATMGRAAMLANLKALAIPILIGAAVAALYLIIEDIVAFLNGEDSFLGFLIQNKDQIFAEIVAFFTTVKGYVVKAVQLATAAILQFFGVPASEAKVTADRIAAAVSSMISFVVANLGTFVSTIRAVFSEIFGLVSALIARPGETLANLGPLLIVTIQGIGMALFGLVTGIIRNVLELFGVPTAKFDEFVTGIRGTAEAIAKVIATLFAAGAEGAIGSLRALADTAYNIISAVMKLISDLFNRPSEALQNFLGNVAGVFTGLVGKTMDISAKVDSTVATGLGLNSGAAASLMPASVGGTGGTTITENLAPVANVTVNVGAGVDASGVANAVASATGDRLGEVLRAAARQRRPTVAR